jgi:sulfite reductase beta subunit-like hemoprotein
LGDLFAADVKVGELLTALRPLIERYAQERRSGESLGDYYQRAMGVVAPRRLLTGNERPTGTHFQGLAVR